jgi:hypothetical protein
MGSTEDRFWSNYYLFAGGGENEEIFLNCEPFRKYLNKIFRVGTTKVIGDDKWPHGVFTQGKIVHNSYESGHQPPEDVHCTMYSLYYKLYFSKYKNELKLEWFWDVRTREEYIDNLIELYSSMAKAFRNKIFVAYIHAYPSWRSCGNFLTDNGYSNAADKNIVILEALNRKATGDCTELFE